MCGGASDTQNQINQQQVQFYQTLQDQYTKVFGEQQNVLGALTSAFTPILQAGPGQAGMPSQEETALRTSATDTTGAAYAAAARATAQQLAARGGGNTVLPSSVNANIQASTANQYAQQLAQQQNAITNQNYNMGYQNWTNAANILGQAAQIYNPTSYSGQATGAGTAAAQEANTITQQNNSMWNAAIGALGGIVGNVGSTLLTGGLSQIPGLSSIMGAGKSALSSFSGLGGPGGYNSNTGLFNFMPTKGTVPFATGSGYTASNPLGVPASA